MRTVGLKVLKNKLSEYVRLASQGETVLIADRDHVVAELVPPRSSRADEVSDAVLAEAVRRGLLTPALLPSRPVAERRPVAKLKELLRELEEDRSR
jgi:antitoxin (DNA-binding transcriptional repressor) of toxin-antitoxin stability system